MQKNSSSVHPLIVSEKSIIDPEKAIWAELIIKGQMAAERVREIWAKERTVGNMVMSWVREVIYDRQGKPINDTVVLELPTGAVSKNILARFVAKTKAFAFLVVERRDKEVRLTLESEHGCVIWVMPIERHGDIWVLGNEKAKRNPTAGGEAVGLLWRPSQAN